MSVLLNNNKIMSLLEANKRAGYDRNEGFLMDLAKEHHALDVLPFLAASDNSFHKYTKATVLGKGNWRDLNEGREHTFGSTESITSPVQIFSAETNISDDVLRTADNPGDVRDSENMLVAEGLVEDFMRAFIYGDIDPATGAQTPNPKMMHGLANHRSKIDGEFCLSANGTGSKLTSVYVCYMGEYGVNVRYNPKLTGGADGIGLSIRDEGAVWTKDQNNRDMKTWKTVYDLTAGLEVRRDKALVRIANINTASGSTFPIDEIIKAIMTMPNGASGACILAPRAVEEMLMKYAFSASQYQITSDVIEGFGPLTRVMGVPVIREEAIVVGEAQLS